MKTDLTMSRIFWALRRHFWTLPVLAVNCKALSEHFECDFLAMTRAGYLHEVEIKRSRADYFKDYEKIALGLWHGKENGYVHEKKHDLIQAGKLSNYFWFCVPEGLVKLEEVPEYAGLIVLRKDRYGVNPVVLRHAPKLHKTKPEQWVRIAMMTNMMFRAWDGIQEQARQDGNEAYLREKAAKA